MARLRIVNRSGVTKPLLGTDPATGKTAVHFIHPGSENLLPNGVTVVGDTPPGLKVIETDDAG